MGKTPTGKDADRYLVPGLVRGLEALQAFALRCQASCIGAAHAFDAADGVVAWVRHRRGPPR